MKLGLIKILEGTRKKFSFLCEKFLRLSVEKMKAGVFVGPPDYISFSYSLNVMSLSVMMRRQPGMLFDMLEQVF
jgi:hypothetical protein